MATKKRSLMFRLMLAINITVLIVLIILISVNLNNTVATSEKQIDSEIEALMNSMHFSYASYIINPDLTNIKRLADNVAQDKNINSIAIFNKDNKLVATAKNSDQEVHKKTDKIYNSRVNIIKLGLEKDGPVGYIELKYNHNNIIDIKKNYYLVGVVSILLSQMILALVIWFFLSRSIKTINLTTSKLKVLSESTSNSSKEVENIDRKSVV